MTEWGVFGIIVAIITFGISVATPIVRLTKAITSLDANIKTTIEQLHELKLDNQDSHKRIWDKNNLQDKRIEDHESRIRVLEHNERG